MKKIAFLLNHYDVHQVPHIVPYAFALSQLYPGAEVDILASSAAEADFAREIGAGFKGHKAQILRLSVPLWAQVVDPIVSKVAFSRKAAVQHHNQARLAAYDVLVVPEMTSLKLKNSRGFENTKFVFTGHGAGDNRHGGSFNDRIGQFDLALMPGEKYAAGLVEAGHMKPEQAKIVGYPKLEAFPRKNNPRLAHFTNDRPVVVYNPHHNSTLSSWPKFGRAVLDFFYDSDDYNLIFAPHTVLFKRSWGKGRSLPTKYTSNDHILIDTGSQASSDLTYLRAADIYLGDVSSQVYEFLETPRPCVFLNSHAVGWQDDPSYRQFQFGPVIESAADLHAALKQAASQHDKYRPAQEQGFNHTFDQAAEPAAVRGAHAIAELAGLTP